MTFTEAALAVLEQAGRPLQVRQIADIAVERGLLSHVGKTPVQTMSARISAAITREGEDCPFVRIRPGVFALTKWKDHPPKPSRPAAAVAAPEAGRAAAKAKPPGRARRPRSEPEPAPPSAAKPAEQRERAAKPAEQRERAAKPAEQRERGAKPVEQRERAAKPVEQRERGAKPRTQPRPEPTPPQPEKPVENEVALEAPRSKRRRTKKARRSAEATLPAESPATTPTRAGVVDRVIGYLGAGRGVAKGSVLSSELGFKGRGAAGALDAVLAADELGRRLSGHSPRLARAGQSWKLAAKDSNGEATELVEKIEQMVAETVEIAAGQVRERLARLTLGELAQIVLIYLGRRGFAEPTPVGHQTERSLHWSVRDPYGGTRAVVLVHDPKLESLNEGYVIRLRGALHHYSAAGGIILATGEFDESAQREARVINLPPIELIGGEKLSREMVRLGLGVRQQQIEIPICDASFFDELL